MNRAKSAGRLWSAFSDATLSNPVGFFFAFRWLTLALAIAIIYTDSAPDVNLRYQPGLLMYAALQLALGTLYAVRLHPRLAATPGGLTLLKPPADLVAVGVADMMSSLAVVYFSGGWGSPFWHFAVTSILVPCFLLSAWWSMVTATSYVAAYVLIVAISGDGLDSATAMGQRSFFFGNLTTAYLVAIVVGYIGALFRGLQAQRLRTRQALEETETLFRLTENVVQAGTDVHELLERATEDIRSAALFDQFAVFLRDQDGELGIASSSVGIEDLPTELVDGAARERRTLVADHGKDVSWQAAVPLVAGDDLIGVMVAGAKGEGGAAQQPEQMLEAIAAQIAIGVHNATLALQKAEFAAEEERGRMAREIHDGIAQSIYMLSLHLETCAELARDNRHDLRERLEKLVALSKETLLEVRHYIFDFRPYLAGEKGVVEMLESQVREFNSIAGVSATVDTRQEEHRVSVPVAACLYRVTQEALANAFKHAAASEVRVILEFPEDGVQLTVEDDGLGFDVAATDRGYGLPNMRQRAEELGGTFSVESKPGAGTRVAIRVPSGR